MAEVELTKEGPVRVITLNRPAKRNAVTMAMQDALVDALAEVAADGGVRALVLTGMGPDFCVGGDRAIAARMEADDNFVELVTASHRRSFAALLALDLPIIAAIEGAAFGFGAELIACCDMVVVSETALIADPHVPYGLAAGPVLLEAWPRQIPRLLASELIMTGRSVTADEAMSLGLANRKVAVGTAQAEALKLAQTLAAMPPYGLSLAKRALRPKMADVEKFYPQALGG